MDYCLACLFFPTNPEKGMRAKLTQIPYRNWNDCRSEEWAGSIQEQVANL